MKMQLQKIDSRIVVAPDADAVAQMTAELLAEAFFRILETKKTVTFIPSSGNTPVKTYEILASKYKTALDWSRITVVQMDEYAKRGLDRELYFETFLQNHLVRPLGIGRFLSMHRGGGLFHPDDYAKKIAALGPIDFALHGIGRNGHIGFNEPGSAENSPTRIVDLAADTVSDNFPNMAEADRPKRGMTLGLETLKNVKHTILIATGNHKSAAVQSLLSKNPVVFTPACILWKSKDFGIIVDKAAANVREFA